MTIRTSTERVIFLISLFSVLPAVSGLSAIPAQERNPEIIGRVLDSESKKPVEFATISAVDSDGKLKTTSSTSADGRFKIFPALKERYSIIVSYVGFKNLSMEIQPDGESHDLGVLYLVPGEELEASGIVAKQLIHRESDRIVYDVASDPDAAKMNIAGFLAGKIPDMKLDASRKGKLAYGDKAISKILIDEKTSGLINEGRQYPMSFIKANYMKKVEIVLPGSPEYNNDTPILLVTLSAPLPSGAAMEIGADADTKGSFSPSLDAIANTPWFGIGIRYGFEWSSSPRLSNRTSREILDSGILTDSETSSWNKGRSHNIGMNYFKSLFNDKVDLNVSLSSSRLKQDVCSRSSSSTADRTAGTDISSLNGSSVNSSTSPMKLNAGVSLSHKWGKNGRKINSVGFKYALKNNETDNTLISSYTRNPGIPVADTIFGSSSSKEHDLNCDLTLRNPKGLYYFKMETDCIFRDYKGESDYSIDYRQRIEAVNAYAGGKLFKKKASWSAGGRMENISNKGVFHSTGDSPLDYHEFNVLPYASLAYGYKRFDFSTMISNSVSRPNVAQLNPYVDRSDPQNLKSGNPELKGSETTFFQASCKYSPTVKWIGGLGLDGNYSISDNAIERIVATDASNVSTTTFANIGHSDSRGIGLNMIFDPGGKGNNRIALHMNWNQFNYTFASGETNSKSVFSASGSLTKMVKGYSFHLLCNISPSLTGAQMKEYKLYPFIHAIVSRYFDKIHLGASLSFDDLVYGRHMVESTIGSDSFIQKNWSERLGRSVSLSLFWRIGAFKSLPAVDLKTYDQQ